MQGAGGKRQGERGFYSTYSRLRSNKLSASPRPTVSASSPPPISPSPRPRITLNFLDLFLTHAIYPPALGRGFVLRESVLGVSDNVFLIRHTNTTIP